MRCWSCGSDIPGGARYILTCPTYSLVEEQKKIRERLEYSGAQTFYNTVEAPDLDFSLTLPPFIGQ